jgi:hypothetical protein
MGRVLVSVLGLPLALASAGAVGCAGGESGRDDASTTGTEASDTLGETGGAAGAEATGATTTEPADGSSGDEDDTTTGEPPEPPDGPQVYPTGRVHSPVSAYVAGRWLEIAAQGPTAHENVFIKAGASSTVSPNTLTCFADDAQVDLDAHAALEPTRQFFLGGDAAGTTPFDRPTIAAEVGRTAGWVIEGDPSPLAQELALLSPRIALVHYGTNDMGFGATYDAALANFYGNLSEVCDELQDQGVLPVLFGITRRADDPGAQAWVATFNTTVRGLAQQRQIPFVDLFEAVDRLPDAGLSGDGLHLNVDARGACVLDPEGLASGYNMRNLVALEALDRLVAVLDDGDDGLEPPLPPRAGDGSPADPIVIDTLPFADSRDTDLRGRASVDVWSGCSDSDESGPEIWYELHLAEARSLRIFVLDREGVDVDVHLLSGRGGADPRTDCLDRADRMIQAALPAGDYVVVVDSWANAGEPLAGPYLLVVTACDDDDPTCP